MRYEGATNNQMELQACIDSLSAYDGGFGDLGFEDRCSRGFQYVVDT